MSICGIILSESQIPIPFSPMGHSFKTNGAILFMIQVLVYCFTQHFVYDLMTYDLVTYAIY